MAIPPDVTIRAGYSANATIVLQRAEDVVSVPEAALQFEGEKTYVFLETAEGYERRDVTTGLSDGINIEIREGLAPGDKVRGTLIITKTK